MPNDRLLKHQDFLWRLARARSNKSRHQLLYDATTEEILTVVEICINILKFRFPMKERQLKRLAHHARLLRQLARVRSEQSARKILLKGEGAMFAALLIPVLTEIASHIVSSFTNKNSE